MAIKRGDVVLVNLPHRGGGSIQSGYRPCVVVQNDAGNRFSSICLVVPVTSCVTKTDLPTHVIYDHLNSRGEVVTNIALCEQIFTVQMQDLKRPKYGDGKINSETMARIDAALKISLGLV